MSMERKGTARSLVPDVEETLAANDGTAIHYYEWRPSEQDPAVRGAILLIHGFGEHLGRYGRLARAFNAEGYVVGGGDHRGMGKSGGARAFVKDAPVLILDEPTSSVDSRTERVILDALDQLMVGRTTVIIAHRLSTIRCADQILVLDEGQIVERGSHRELLERGGLYAELYRIQSGALREAKEVPV